MEEATDNSVVSYGDWYIKEAPRHLDDIYGQEAIVKALKKQMKERNFSKAYFFSGQFGSGKTAIAKITFIPGVTVHAGVVCQNIKHDHRIDGVRIFISYSFDNFIVFYVAN